MVSKRAINAEIVYLMERGISCVRLSDYHFRVGTFFDFWPSTGKWKTLPLYGSKSGRGKESLESAVADALGKDSPRLDGDESSVTIPPLARPQNVVITKKRSRKNRR